MLTYGFYNSMNHDRVYDALQISSIFDGIIEDGVYSNIGEFFATVPGTGMGVIVKTGRAWFDHTWTVNDSHIPLEIDDADFLQTRIDTVILEVDSRVEKRENSIKVVKGIPSVNPVKPNLLHDGGIFQHPLAYITVTPGLTEITGENIQIAVGTTDCPFVRAPLETVSIEDLWQQWDTEFTTWFNDLKATMTDNVVGNLQYQIDQNKNSIATINNKIATMENANTETFSYLENGKGPGSAIYVHKHYTGTITDAICCDGRTVPINDIPNLFPVIRTENGIQLSMVNSTSASGFDTNYTTVDSDLVNGGILAQNIATNGTTYYFIVYRVGATPLSIGSVNRTSNAYTLASFLDSNMVFVHHSGYNNGAGTFYYIPDIISGSGSFQSFSSTGLSAVISYSKGKQYIMIRGKAVSGAAYSIDQYAIIRKSTMKNNPSGSVFLCNLKSAPSGAALSGTFELIPNTTADDDIFIIRNSNSFHIARASDITISGTTANILFHPFYTSGDSYWNPIGISGNYLLLAHIYSSSTMNYYAWISGVKDGKIAEYVKSINATTGSLQCAGGFQSTFHGVEISVIFGVYINGSNVRMGTFCYDGKEGWAWAYDDENHSYPDLFRMFNSKSRMGIRPNGIFTNVDIYSVTTPNMTTNGGILGYLRTK